MRVNGFLLTAGLFSLVSMAPSAALAQAQPRMQRGWVGIAYTTGIGQSDRNGAMVFTDYPVIESIDPGSPAERAGLQAGDRIISLDAQDLRKNPMPPSLLEPGRRIVFRYRRNDVAKTSTVVVASRPGGTRERTAFEFIQSLPLPRGPVRPAPESRPSGRRAGMDVPLLQGTPAPFAFSPSIGVAGAVVTELNDDLRELLELKTNGVFVVNVALGTPASESGLRSGDVIIIANSLPVRHPGELLSILRADGDNSVRLEIIRRKKQQVINLGW
ncbi:MAG: PDZ domain-containing protein [Gemmatimonadaceae bacterium]|nr:PDZ domain-containing protein [Gemmatimonadaceae bacterium]